MKTHILPEIGKIYVHHKGGRYKVIALARMEDTGFPVVVYQSVEYPCITHTYVRSTYEWWDKFKLEENWDD